MDFTGRRVLVTAGGDGIGRGIATAFLQRGATVVVTDVVPDSVRAAQSAGLDARLSDAADERAVSALMADIEAELGGLDILVNNADKQTAVEHVEDLDDAQFEATFRTNVFAPFWLIKAALPHLAPGAAIINTASLEAYVPAPDRLDYAATKAAINNLSKGLAQQLAPRGIRVNVVAPGPTWTALQVSDGVSDEQMTHFDDENEYRRAGQPAEIAPAFVFLASAESGYVSGETLNVNGGMVTP